MMNRTNFHVIKDPVHGTMQFTSAENAWVKPFIDHPNFQRLRHIKQMGLGDFIFPGAVHTRFNHSLGCCYVASQIAHKVGLVDEERQLVMLACLLHDVGHGPFSHAFEGLFYNKIIRHEDWTPHFLSDLGTHDFFMQYNRVNPRYHLTEDKFHTIADMIMHRTKIKNVLADIVSSQLDADRLDYLPRDGHFCGVRYADFDFRWMLHCMAIVESPHGERLGITYKGIGTVEHYLMARRLMVRNIYQTPKKLALEALLVHLLSNLAENLEFHAPYASIRQSKLGKFLVAANHFNQGVESSHHNEEHKSEFLETNYDNYKNLCDYDVFSLIRQLDDLRDTDAASQMAFRFQNRIVPKILRIDHVNLPKIEDELREFKQAHRGKYQDWQLMLVHTPHQAYSGEEDPILVIGEYGDVHPIGDVSFTINAIADRLEHADFLCVDHVIMTDPVVSTFVKHVHEMKIMTR